MNVKGLALNVDTLSKNAYFYTSIQGIVAYSLGIMRDYYYIHSSFYEEKEG